MLWVQEVNPELTYKVCSYRKKGNKELDHQSFDHILEARKKEIRE
jgi:hypothetical protein